MGVPLPSADNFQLQCDQLAKNLMSTAGQVNDTLLSVDPGGNNVFPIPVNCIFRYNGSTLIDLAILSAAIIARYLPQPLTVGQTFTFTIAAGALGGVQLSTSASDITNNIPNPILAGTRALCKGSVTQAYTTKTSSVGGPYRPISVNKNPTYFGSAIYTVTTANSTSSPVVGTVIYINVKSGTLPSGWYPVVKIVSANIFQICTGDDSTKTVTSFDFTPPAPLTTPQWCPLIELNKLYTVSGVSF